jgi:hypothetical protein
MILFKPFWAPAKILRLEPFEDSLYGDTHRVVLEFDTYEADLRVPVSRLRELIDSGRHREPREDKVPATERHGFSIGDHVVFPEHGVGKILAIENQDTGRSKGGSIRHPLQEWRADVASSDPKARVCRHATA